MPEFYVGDFMKFHYAESRIFLDSTALCPAFPRTGRLIRQNTIFSGMIQSGFIQGSVYSLFRRQEVIIPENRVIIHPVLPDFTSENRR
jgi:hypothetical protein